MIAKERTRPANPDKSEGEQATDQTLLHKTSVCDAMVIGAGKLITEWRKKLCLSRRRLAHILGYTETQTHYWENNKQSIYLQDLQQLSHMVSEDLEQALRTLAKPPENQNIAIEWKGTLYTIEQFKDSIQKPHATLDYSQAQQTYYLKLNPIANLEFHRRDILTTVLEKEGVQAITELTAEKGTRANIMKTTVERMNIKPGDKLDIQVLKVRRHEEEPWKKTIQVTQTKTTNESRMLAAEKLGELNLKLRNGDYARIAIQTDQGEVLATGQIEDGAIKLSEEAAKNLQTKGGGLQTLAIRTNSIVLSHESLTEKTPPPPKPRARTVFKLDSKEITIQHENQEYKITTIETEKIGNLHIYRYKTKQGEEILHIPTLDKTIPPYETPWYALPQTIAIYLDKKYKHELLQAAINKAGGKTQLRQELKKRHTYTAIKYLNDQLTNRMDGMLANKLIPILTYLNKDLDEPNNHITAIGNARAIKNPRIPFKLNTPHGARIIAARYSDGSIHTPKHAGPRFEYTNKDTEQRNRVSESLRSVFGEVNLVERVYYDDRIPRLRATTDIVGHVLQRAGAITGRIIVQNPDVPAFIKLASKEMKREWLIQAFGDEGSPSPRTGITTLSRSKDVTGELTEECRNQLDVSSERWKEKTSVTIVRKKQRKFCPFRELPKGVQDSLTLEGPRLLESEAKMLHDDFAIHFRKHPVEMYKRQDGYSVTWNLQIISKEENTKFYDEIGFPQNRKQEKLAGISGTRKNTT